MGIPTVGNGLRYVEIQCWQLDQMRLKFTVMPVAWERRLPMSYLLTKSQRASRWVSNRTMGMHLKQSKGGHIMQMDTQALRALCVNRKAIPHEFFIDVMKGQLKCRTCKGAGLKRYRLDKQVPCTCDNPAHCWRCDGTGQQIWDERVCPACEGDGDEVVSPETSLNAAAHLAKYVAAQLKQVEHSGTVTHEHTQAVALSKLAPEELDTMERLLRKAELLPAGEVVDVEVVN